MMRQVRKAVGEIQETINEGPHLMKVAYQLDMLRKMIDETPSRQKPWSYYREQVEEEFNV